MDEMPTADYVQRVLAIARFMDSPARQAFTFVVTCRYADFVQLRDHTTNLRLQRWDLLPWTGRMARAYLRSRDSDVVLDQRGFYDPLEIALRAEVSGPAAEEGADTIWDEYLLQRLAAVSPSAEQAVTALARLAYEQTWPSSSWQPPPAVVDAATEAGLLRGTEFEIRPLAHHLAGKELWHRVEATGGLPPEVRLDDINVRETIKSAGSHAGADPRWAAALSAALGAPGGKRTRGDRLSVAAHVLAPSHLATSEALRVRIVSVIRAQVAADDVERVRSLEALGKQPALLDPDLPDTADLFTWITERGSPGAVGWLLELFVRDTAVRRRYRALLRALVGRILDRGHFTSQVQSLLSRLLAGVRSLRPVVSGSRFGLLGLGFYLSYLPAWTAAMLVLLPVHHGLDSGWPQTLGLAGLWVAGQSLGYVVVSVWFARSLLLPRDDRGPERWWTRFAVFVAIIFATRVVWDVFNVLIAIPPAKWMARSAALLLVLPFVVAVAVLVGWQWFRRPTRAAGSGTDDMAGRWRVYVGTTTVILSVFVVFFLDEPWLGVVFGLAGLALVAVDTIVLQPRQTRRRTRQHIRRLAREDMTRDLHAAVSAILRRIADDKLPVLVRVAYVDGLSEVHFTDALRHKLEATYASLPPGPVYTRLTDVVLRAHHEHCKERSAGHD
jgi:hypothetical protein